MGKMSDDGPALADLRKLGYQWLGQITVGRQGRAYLMLTTKGKQRKVKIQKRRRGPVDEGDRAYFGIMKSSLEDVDELVLWVEGEKKLFIIPSKYLRRVLEERKDDARFFRNAWRVNVYFNSSYLLSVGSGGAHRYSLVDYAKPIPD